MILLGSARSLQSVDGVERRQRELWLMLTIRAKVVSRTGAAYSKSLPAQCLGDSAEVVLGHIGEGSSIV